MKREHNTYELYYDELGDYLELTFGEAPQKEYGEEIEPGVFVTRDESTDEIKSLGIINYKQRPTILAPLLKKIKKAFPFNVVPVV